MLGLQRKFVTDILVDRNYPPSWIDSNLFEIDEEDFKGFALKNRNGNAFLLVAVAEEGRIEHAEAMTKSAAFRWPTAGVGIATDCRHSRFFSRRFDSDKYEQQRELENYSLGPSSALNMLRNLREDTDLALGRILSPLTAVSYTHLTLPTIYSV